MWKVFSSESVHYMIKLKFSEDICVYVTDLKFIWKEVIASEIAFGRFQEANPTFEVNLETAINQIVLLVSSVGDSTDVEICKCESHVELTVKGSLSEFPIEYKFFCNLADTETYFQEVTIPLLLTIKDQENKTELLCSLLQRKDREIEEHVMENGQISRKNLITDTFKKDEKEPINKIDSFVTVFGSSPTFWKSFVGKHDPENKFISIKECPSPPKKIKLKVYSSETIKKRV